MHINHAWTVGNYIEQGRFQVHFPQNTCVVIFDTTLERVYKMNWSPLNSRISVCATASGFSANEYMWWLDCVVWLLFLQRSILLQNPAKTIMELTEISRWLSSIDTLKYPQFFTSTNNCKTTFFCRSKSPTGMGLYYIVVSIRQVLKLGRHIKRTVLVWKGT